MFFILDCLLYLLHKNYSLLVKGNYFSVVILKHVTDVFIYFIGYSRLLEGTYFFIFFIGYSRLLEGKCLFPQ